MFRPKITEDQAKKVVFDLYGLRVIEISELNGYDDKNFHVLVDSEGRSNQFFDKIYDSGYVLKITNSLDSQHEKRFEAQSQLLYHLNQHNIRCPQPILTNQGMAFSKITLSSGEHVVTLLEFIEGIILYKVECTTELFYQVGVLTARIDDALESFDHPVYHQKIQWGLSSVPDILDFLYVIDDEAKRKMVTEIVIEFTSRVLSIENQLKRGIIHGDINEQNLLVEKNPEWNIKAVIDFGDSQFSPYLYELALAMTYMILVSNDLNSGSYVYAGYSSVRDVPLEEFKLLRICVLARFCQSLVLGAYTSSQDPNNQYVLTTAKKGWDLLEQLSEVSEETMLHMWQKIPNKTQKIVAQCNKTNSCK